MEEWQTKIIKSNIRKLISITLVNTSLLASLEEKDVLSSEEIERIGAYKVNVDKARDLYDTIQTRSDSFIVLIEVLNSTNQSGAYHVLFQESKNVFSKNLEAVIGTQKMLLADKLGKRDMENLISWIQKHIDIEAYKALISSEGPITLVTSNIPEAGSLYISRHLSRRLVLHQDIFKIKAKDIFVFKNLTRLKLYKFVGKNVIGFSSEQIFDITSRFILLDDAIHWNELKSSATSPIHLIAFKDADSTFVLEETSGGIEVLQKFLQHGTNELRILETHLISTDRAASEKGLCICDSPGMGKTMLLANLARYTQEKYPERVICFIQLSKLAQFLSKNSEPTNLETVKSVLVECMSNSPLTKYLLTILLDANLIHLELFFDGLDEVQASHLDSITRFLLITLDLPNCRIYATSRPHLRKELQSATRFVAYDIIPFDEESQILYLVSIWRQHVETDETRLEDFARRCLKVFRKTVNSDERKFLGIPLQCRMFGSIYSELARKYTLLGKRIKIDDKVFVKNVWEMYKFFMDQRLPKSECNFQCILISDSRSNFSGQISQIVSNFKELHMSEIVKPGVLISITAENAVQFLHRTFAEYLCAEFFSSQMQVGLAKVNGNLELAKEAVAFVFADLIQTKSGPVFSTDRSIFSDFETMVEFRHPTTVYFFENGLKPDVEQTHFPAKLLQCCIQKDFSTFFGVACAALKSSYKQILETLVFQCLMPSQSTTKSIASHFASSSKNNFKLLNTAVRYCNASTITTVIDMFLQAANINLFDVLDRIKVDKWSPLDIAVTNADFDKVNMFYDTFQKDNRGLIYFLVAMTTGLDQEALEKRKEVCELLLEKNPGLLFETLEEDGEEYTGPVVAPGISFELIKYLLEKGADMRAYFSGMAIRSNIIGTAAQSMDATEFHKLVEFIIQMQADKKIKGLEKDEDYECDGGDLFTANDVWDSPLYDMFTEVRGLKLETVELILQQKNHADVNIHIKGKSLVYWALEGSQHLDIIKYLENHVDRIHDTCNKSTIIHFALERKNNDAVVYLASLPCTDIEEKDDKSRTPILVAAEMVNFEMMDHLFELGANLFAVDYQGNSFLLVGAKSFYRINDLQFHNTVVWLQRKCNTVCPIKPAFNDAGEPVINSNCLAQLFGMPNHHGQTPLVNLSMLFGIYPETIKIFWKYRKSELGKFLNHPVEINAKDKNGKTFLHRCVLENVPVRDVDLMIGMENGLNWRVKDNNQCNITHYCVEEGNYELLQYFVGKGCDVNELDKHGNNALQCYFRFERGIWDPLLNEKIMIALVEAGLNFDNVNLDGKNALMMMKASRHYQKLSKLEKYFNPNI